ncbi:MAG: tRNA ((37)-N6)-threonylcarbamoyltransferase complex dimerization subunit type 1 TsaB [Actinomycetota bacterium]|jgi:tRNA threonylcarbamoyl adenosine modification protein YeaZ
MRILALDTSTSRVTVALLDDEQVIYQVSAGELTGGQFHGEQLMDLVSECLQGQKPERIAVGIGPGPYTGLRVGVTTAEVLAPAWEIEVVGIPTLAALAHGHIRRGGQKGTAVLDVKRKEIACQDFSETGELLGQPVLVHITEFEKQNYQNIVGPAFITQTLITANVGDQSPVDAIDIALLGLKAKVELFKPLYLRQPDAAEPKPPKPVNND